MHARLMATMFALLVSAGCNTFFESAPEYLGTDDAGDSGDASQVDVVENDAGDGDTGGEDASTGETRPWSVKGVAASEGFLPTLSLTGAPNDGDGGAEFGVAFIELDGAATDRGSAVLQRVSLPDLSLSGRQEGANGDQQWDVATGLDAMGRLVWGTVQPCRNLVTARIFHSPDPELDSFDYNIRTCPADPMSGPTQMALVGGLEAFNTSTGPDPRWVWTEGGDQPQVVSMDGAFTASEAIIHDFGGRQVDPGFIRSSGGSLIMMRDAQTSTAVIWDGLNGEGVAPYMLDVDLEAGGDLVWLEEDHYVLVTYRDDEMLTLESLQCSLNATLECEVLGTIQQFFDRDVLAFRAAAFHGGFVVATLNETNGDQDIFFRTFSANPGDFGVSASTLGGWTVPIDEAEPEAFDVGAAFLGEELFVAAAVIRAGTTQAVVDLHGYRFPGMLSELLLGSSD